MASLFYEDLAVGQEFRSHGRTVTEADIMAFAGVSGDFNQLHTDAEFAAQTPFGSRVAHGLLILAMVSGLKQRLALFDGTTLAFLGLKWDFKGAVKPGDTIHLLLTISDKRETKRPDRGIVTQSIQVFNQRGEVVQVGEHVLMLQRRPG